MIIKRKKFWILGCAIVFFLFAAIFVLDNKQMPESGWKNVRPVPFDGYICGYEGTETFLQLPIFLPKEDTVSIEDISRIVFSNNEKEYHCSNYQLSSFQESLAEEYQFATLSFRVALSEQGASEFDNLMICLKNNEVLNWELGDIQFVVIEKENIPEMLSMSQFIVNQTDLSHFKVAYVNHSDKNIVINDFSYPEDICKGFQIAQYEDFQLNKKEDGFVIPPSEERTFLLSMETESEKKEIFYYMLPFVSFQYGDKVIKMPAQTQATVVQTPFTKKFICDLMK